MKGFDSNIYGLKYLGAYSYKRMENHFLITCGYPCNYIKSTTSIRRRKMMMGNEVNYEGDMKTNLLELWSPYRYGARYVMLW